MLKLKYILPNLKFCPDKLEICPAESISDIMKGILLHSLSAQACRDFIITAKNWLLQFHFPCRRNILDQINKF